MAIIEAGNGENSGSGASGEILEPGDPRSILTEPIWEKQIELGETDEQYAMFLAFASLHPQKRRLEVAWRIWREGGTRISATFSRAARRFQWQRRAAAWDVHKLKEIQHDWVVRDNQRREEDYTLAELIRRIAKERLEGALVTDEEVSLNTALKMAELASKLQADAVPDLRLDRDEVKGLIAALPDERRKAIIAILVEKFG